MKKVAKEWYYFADDGTVFKSEQECKQYEQMMLSIKPYLLTIGIADDYYNNQVDSAEQFKVLVLNTDEQVKGANEIYNNVVYNNDEVINGFEKGIYILPLSYRGPGINPLWRKVNDLDFLTLLQKVTKQRCE